MRVGLLIGAGAALWVALASWLAGYDQEVAILRGVLAWVLVMLVAYVGELIVSTTPRHQAERPAARPEPARTVLTGEVTDGDDEPMVA